MHLPHSKDDKFLFRERKKGLRTIGRLWQKVMKRDTQEQSRTEAGKRCSGKKRTESDSYKEKDIEGTAREIKGFCRFYFLRGRAAILCVSDPV